LNLIEGIIINFLHLLLAQASPAASGDTAADGAPADAGPAVDPDPAAILEKLQTMIQGGLKLLPNLAIAIVVLVLFYIAACIVAWVITRTTSNRESANIGKVLGRLSRWVIMLGGLMVAVAIVSPGVGPGDLLATLGIGGVAIGFAFKDILQNFLAGVLILLREPFRIGDQIRSGDFEGTVETIETRATIIRTYDGKRVVIPNADIYTNPVVVNTAHKERRSQYDIGIGYGDNLREAIKLIQQTMESVDGVKSDPAPEVIVQELAGSTVNLRARWWTEPDQASTIKAGSEVVASVKEALDEAGIDMPFPTNVMLFHDQTEESDGDRTRQREGWPAGKQPPAQGGIAAAMRQNPAGASGS